MVIFSLHCLHYIQLINVASSVRKSLSVATLVTYTPPPPEGAAAPHWSLQHTSYGGSRGRRLEHPHLHLLLLLVRLTFSLSSSSTCRCSGTFLDTTCTRITCTITLPSSEHGGNASLLICHSVKQLHAPRPASAPAGLNTLIDAPRYFWVCIN